MFEIKEPCLKLRCPALSGANVWNLERDWPLPGTAYTQYYLGRQNTLSLSSGASGGDTIDYDPDDPCPTLGGNNCCGCATTAQRGHRHKSPPAAWYSPPAANALAAMVDPRPSPVQKTSGLSRRALMC